MENPEVEADLKIGQDEENEEAFQEIEEYEEDGPVLNLAHHHPDVQINGNHFQVGVLHQKAHQGVLSLLYYFTSERELRESEILTVKNCVFTENPDQRSHQFLQFRYLHLQVI